MTDFTKRIQIALLVVMVTAGGAACISAQAPAAMSRDRYKAILTEAQGMSSTIDTLSRDILRYSRNGAALAEAIKAHNEEPCESLNTHPEMCLEYHDEELRLNRSRDSLLKEWKNAESDRRRARGYFGELMEQLRSATWTGTMATWKARAIDCSNMDNMAQAAACLKRELDRHP